MKYKLFQLRQWRWAFYLVVLTLAVIDFYNLGFTGELLKNYVGMGLAGEALAMLCQRVFQARFGIRAMIALAAAAVLFYAFWGWLEVIKHSMDELLVKLQKTHPEIAIRTEQHHWWHESPMSWFILAGILLFLALLLGKGRELHQLDASEAKSANT